MSELLIKVGASVDRNLAVAYRPLVDAANRAAAQIAAAGAKGGQAVSSSTKRGTDTAEKEYAKLARSAERWKRDMVRGAEKASRDEARAAEKAAANTARAAEKAARDQIRAAEKASREQIRAAEKATKARERENQKIVRDVERSERAAERISERAASAKTRANERALARSGRDGDRDRRRYAGYAMSAVRQTVGAGIGLARGVAGGMGVDLDLGSHITKGVNLEKNAVALSNSSYFAGKAGAAGQRQDPKALIDEVRRTAMATGNDSGDTMAGLQAFVSKTGDLESGRAILFDLSKLAKATGTDMGDMVDAAGDVANALGDVPNKGAAIKSVMTAIAAQGKEGAVEIKALATQMAKLGAASTQFTGDSAQSMANMGALVQMTRAKGGASSSTQAATSVGGFVNTFSKGARRKAFTEAGVNVEAADGKLRNPRDIIIDALRATKGDNLKMGKLFADVSARRVTRGFETTYKEAGGGEAGIRAVQRAFDDLARSTMLQKEIEESFARSMQTSDAKAKIFNEQMGKVAMELQAGFLPALQAIAPVLVSTGGKMADWVAEITGAKEKKQRSEEVGVEMRALNARSSLRNVLATGRTVDGETEEAGKAKVDLAAAIEAKKKQLDTEGKLTGRGEGATASVKQLSKMTNEELSYAANVRGDQDAATYQRDKQQLERMQDTLSTLDKDLQSAMQRALEGSVITVRLNDPLQIATPSISTPNAGREPPPGAKK